MKFKLPELAFQYNALEPYIDGKTMEIHHSKHHNGYVTKLNAALEGNDTFSDYSIEDLLIKLDTLPDSIKTAVRNNGGGHYNHTLFWESLRPGGKELSTFLSDKINDAFGSFDAFKDVFKKAALTQFGSGWAWLIVRNNKLEVVSSANQDNPISHGGHILLGLDVWEHAYYLNYQNKRDAYINEYWNIVDWSVVEARLKATK